MTMMMTMMMMMMMMMMMRNTKSFTIKPKRFVCIQQFDKRVSWSTISHTLLQKELRLTSASDVGLCVNACLFHLILYKD